MSAAPLSPPPTSLARTLGDRRRWYLGLVLALLPVGLMVSVLAQATSNAPASDDYSSILPFLCDWQGPATLAERWTSLTGQFYGHRIIFTKLVALADYRLFGSCHLVGLQMFSLTGWLVAVGALLGSVPAIRRDPWLALPVTLLLMHPQGYSSLLTAIGLCNLWVVAFVVLAMLGAASPRPAGWILSVFFASLATMCFANGLLAFPTIALGLLLRCEFRRAAMLALAGALVWALYLHGYQADMGSLSLRELIRKAAIMTGGFAALGSLPVSVALVVGSLVLLFAGVLLCVRRFRRELPAHMTFLLFCGLTVLMAARGRAGWVDSYMLQDRYRLYGLLLLAVGYLAAITLGAPWRRWIGLSAVTLAAIYCFFSYVTHLAPLWSSQAWYQATALNGQIGVGFPHTTPANWQPAIVSLEQAAAADVYHLPRLLSAPDVATIQALPTMAPTSAFAYKLQADGSVCGHYLIPIDQGPAPDFAVLVSPTRRMILPVVRLRAKVAELAQVRSLLAARFGFVLPGAVYQSGLQSIYGLRRDAAGRLAVVSVTSQVFP